MEEAPPPCTIMGHLRKWSSRTTEESSHTIDQQITIISKLQPPLKRHGKRKKPCPLRYDEFVIEPRRIWPEVPTFGLMITLVLALSAGEGAPNSRVLGSEAVSSPLYAVDTTGLHHADGWPSSPLRQQLHSPSGHTLSLEGEYRNDRGRKFGSRQHSPNQLQSRLTS